MERMRFVMELNPGREETDDRVHQQVPSGVRAALVEGYNAQAVLANQRSHPAVQGWAPALTGVAKSRLEVAEEAWRL